MARREPPAVPAPGSDSERRSFEVAFQNLTAQLEDVKTIDQGFCQGFSIASTILPITAGFIGTRDSLVQESLVARIALLAAFGFYLWIFGVLLSSVRVAKWDSRPESSQWSEVTRGRGEAEMHR